MDFTSQEQRAINYLKQRYAQHGPEAFVISKDKKAAFLIVKPRYKGEHVLERYVESKEQNPRIDPLENFETHTEDTAQPDFLMWKGLHPDWEILEANDYWKKWLLSEKK